MNDIYIILAIVVLTVPVVFAIIKSNKKRKLNIKSIRFSQSSLHVIIKDLLPTNSELKKKVLSQSRLLDREKNIRIVYTPDNKAYWVKNNIFYCANIVDGTFDPSTGKPIETEHLSKKQLEELLFILDNLNKG